MICCVCISGVIYSVIRFSVRTPERVRLMWKVCTIFATAHITHARVHTFLAGLDHTEASSRIALKEKHGSERNRSPSDGASSTVFSATIDLTHVSMFFDVNN